MDAPYQQSRNPKVSGAEPTVAEISGGLKQQDDRYIYTAFDHRNPHKVETVKQYAIKKPTQGALATTRSNIPT